MHAQSERERQKERILWRLPNFMRGCLLHVVIITHRVFPENIHASKPTTRKYTCLTKLICKWYVWNKGHTESERALEKWERDRQLRNAMYAYLNRVIYAISFVYYLWHRICCVTLNILYSYLFWIKICEFHFFPALRAGVRVWKKVVHR